MTQSQLIPTLILFWIKYILESNSVTFTQNTATGPNRLFLMILSLSPDLSWNGNVYASSMSRSFASRGEVKPDNLDFTNSKSVLVGSFKIPHVWSSPRFGTITYLQLVCLYTVRKIATLSETSRLCSMSRGWLLTLAKEPLILQSKLLSRASVRNKP